MQFVLALKLEGIESTHVIRDEIDFHIDWRNLFSHKPFDLNLGGKFESLANFYWLLYFIIFVRHKKVFTSLDRILLSNLLFCIYGFSFRTYNQLCFVLNFHHDTPTIRILFRPFPTHNLC